MNNKYIFAAICIATLACAPACKKEKPATTPQQKEIRTTIEVDNAIIEIEDGNIDIKTSVAKF